MNNHINPVNWDVFFEQFLHGLLVIKEDRVVHAVDCPQHATEPDARALVQELKTDVDLELMDLTDYHVLPVSGEEWRKYMNIFVGDE